MHIFAVYSPSYPLMQNIILAGYKSETPVAVLPAYEKNEVAVERLDLKTHPIFTDNYAPVEYFIIAPDL
jgi:hypothetical protein